jgi:hypothetical protein
MAIEASASSRYEPRWMQGAFSFIDLTGAAKQSIETYAECPFDVPGSVLGYNPDLMNSTNVCNSRLWNGITFPPWFGDATVITPLGGPPA